MMTSMWHAMAMVLAMTTSSSLGFQSPSTLQPLPRPTALTPPRTASISGPSSSSSSSTTTSLEMVFGFGKKNDDDDDEEAFLPGKKMNKGRRRKLGVNDDEEEYDLEMALDNSTDPLITKIIAGSFILSIIALLVVGLVIPATTDYGDGVCNALLSGGRC